MIWRGLVVVIVIAVVVVVIVEVLIEILWLLAYTIVLLVKDDLESRIGAERVYITAIDPNGEDGGIKERSFFCSIVVGLYII